MDKVYSLLTLKPRWDSYGAKPITIEAVEAAVTFLSKVQAVPTPEGGVSLEWLTGGWELEIDISPAGKVEVIVCEKHPWGM